ncbi:DUF3885 domain-containing protein [Paraliobacillus sp. JSM ZJ581]|uniref:DUF3885 domain-containing protein n=1 Tax=Paraliobacillus sp. JSM ZJ581 TaxID=3342118 RepID=UPI0035A91A53
MDIVNYLDKHFSGVKLVPSIYYQWDIGIHFSLGKGMYQFKESDKINLELFNTVYKQTLTIFNELFDQKDDLILVTNTYCQKELQNRKRLAVYQSNLRDKNNLRNLKVKTFPYPFEIDISYEYEMQQFALHCKVNDIRIDRLLKAAINEDFPSLKPRFGSNYSHYPDVFFVNITKGIIFFVYDDRGCEVIACTSDRLRPLYEKHFNLVDDLDRERIEKGLGY